MKRDFKFMPKGIKGLQKGHPFYKGGEKNWFKKGQVPWNKGIIGKASHSYGNQFAKGLTPWSKGKKGIHLSPKTEFKKGQNIGEKNYNWTGDKITYFGLHKWLSIYYGKANQCQGYLVGLKCNGKSKKYHWAKLKGKKYERKRENFIMLCVSCHRKYDGIPPNSGQFKKGHKHNLKWYKAIKKHPR